MPPISHFSKHDIAERWAKSIKAADAAMEAIQAEIDLADAALVNAGISSIGSLSERITRLATERDLTRRKAAHGCTDASCPECDQ